MVSASASRSRPGFTLLELLLALGIGVMLLGAVYVALDVQLRLAEAGRDVVEESTVARNLLRRISDDIASSTTLSDPGRFRRAEQSSGTSGSTQGSTSGSSSQDPASGDQDMTEGEEGESALPVSLIFPLGVRGDAQQLHLFTSRLPREAFRPQPEGEERPFSDLRRISYWLAGAPDNPDGLARQEVALPTTEAAISQILPGPEAEAEYILAPEVKDVTFSYYDGTQWLESWDSTSSGADGVTPVGPPRAVAILIGLRTASSEPETEESGLRYYRHVVAILTANGMQTGTTQTMQGP